MKKDDCVGLKLAHLLEQHPVLRGPGLRRTGAQLVDAEQNIDLAVAPLCERLSKRQLALRGGEDRLFRRGKDRQPVVAEIACVVQPCVNLEAVNVRIADKKRVVKVACVHRGEGQGGLRLRFRLGQRLRNGLRRGEGLGSARRFAPGIDPVRQRIGDRRDRRGQAVKLVEVGFVDAGRVERGVDIERRRAERAQQQKRGEGAAGHKKPPKSWSTETHCRTRRR